MVNKDYVESLKSQVEYLKESKNIWRQQACDMLEEIAKLKSRIAELEDKHDTRSQSKKESI